MVDLKEYERMYNECLRCSMCKWIPQVQIKNQEFATGCPSVDRYNYHGYSGGGRLVLALSIMSGRIPLDKDAAEVIYKCTECGSCDIACKYLNNLEPVEVIQALREKAVAEGVGPLPIHKKFVASIDVNHNPYGEPHNERFSWIPDDVKITPGASTLYFVGCTSSYRQKDIAISTARLLNAANVEFDIMGEDEYCCGSPELRVGHRDKYNEIANHNITKVKEMGIKEVIFSCAGCYAMFKVYYPSIQKSKYKVTHTTELFNDLISEGKLKLKKELDLTVTYHDPCHLGRGSEKEKKWFGVNVPIRPLVKVEMPTKQLRCGGGGVYEPPRELIRKIPGIKFVEMDRIREYSYCCGAGGGVKSAYPEFAEFTSKNRVKEALSTKADTLLTACPFCTTNLKDGIAALKSDMKMYDLSVLLYMALGRDE